MPDIRPGVDYIGISTPFYCHDGNGNFLFHKRSQNCRDEQGTWDMGGGRLEFGEEPAVGVLREVEEEYGCVGVIDEALPIYNIFRKLADGTPTHWIAVPFIIRVNRDEVKLNEPKKMDDLGWFKLDALPQPLHQGMKLGLDRFSASFKRYA